jgi:hypothetical protein
MGLSRVSLGIVAGLCAIAMLPSPVKSASWFGAVAVASPNGLVQPALFGHTRRATESYCYPRNYWWFYRPYTTAAEGDARCMPYFHYLPQAYRGRGGEAPPK